MEKTVVIKLGGSMVSNSDEPPFDFEYLNNFASVLKKYVKEGYKFVIILGGGFMMRKFRDLAKANGILEDSQLHWIGTTYNNVNAEIVRAYMNEICNERIIAYEDYYDKKKHIFEKGRSIIVGGGERAGHSGDLDALIIAQSMNIKTIVSLKNIDGVYTADPKKDPSATRVDKINWDQYFDIIGHKKTHEPGGNYPIDPIAARQAKEGGVSFVVIDGNALENFEKVLKGEKFAGTLVF